MPASSGFTLISAARIYGSLLGQLLNGQITFTPVNNSGVPVSFRVGGTGLAGVTITAWSIAGNVATFTAANTLTAGVTGSLGGFGTSTFFNGVDVTVSASGLSGTQFEAAFTHANGSATEAGAFIPLGGDGMMVSSPIGFPVVNGAIVADSSGIPPQLPDTTLTSPENIGYAVSVINPLTGKNIFPTGYSCIQPSGPTFDLDTYPPNMPVLATQSAGPAGPAGAAGSGFQTISIEHVFASAGTFNFVHNLGFEYPMMTAFVKSGTTSFTAGPVDANTMAITVAGASDILITFAYSQIPTAPAITSNPTNWGGAGTSNFTFSAAASGYPLPSVQWQTDSGTGGVTWTNVSGATSTTYSASASAANGWQFRAVFSNTSGTATTAAATASVASLASGLVNYWPMNEGTGTTLIDSVAGNNLAAAGITWSGGTASFSGSAGVSGAYTNTQPGPLNNATTPFTISAWVNFTTPDSAYLLANSAGVFSGNDGWQFTIAGSGYPIVALYQGTTFPLLVDGTSAAVAAGVRQNIIITYDGSKNATGVNIYLNGTLLTRNVVTNTLSSDIATPADSLFVMGEPGTSGAPGTSQNNTAGTMDHLRIYNRVLNSGEIALIQTGGN